MTGDSRTHGEHSAVNDEASLPCKSGEGAGEREAIARVIDPNAWDHADFRASKGFEENERITRPSLMTADRILALRTDATQTREAELVVAIAGIADDYMTSEVHHPGYVLIPTERFEKLAALPGAKS